MVAAMGPGWGFASHSSSRLALHCPVHIGAKKLTVKLGPKDKAFYRWLLEE